MFWKGNIEHDYRNTPYRWLVFRFDFNKREPGLYNVLEHPSIVEVCRAAGKHIRLKSFEKRLALAVNHEFWCRAQWEMSVTDNNPYITTAELDRLIAEHEHNPNHVAIDVRPIGCFSLDVAYQLEMNWKPFLHYVYRHRTEIVEQYDNR